MIARHMYLRLLPLFFLCSCSSDVELTAPVHRQQFFSRDEGQATQRFAVYRGIVPTTWQRKDPVDEQSIADTMLPIAEFMIGSAGDAIRITLHTFPSQTYQERVPPAAQISRWRQQFERLTPTAVTITPVSRGGFCGLFFAATGRLEGCERTMLGWSMQMPVEQYLNLQGDDFRLRQRRADFTIKIVGAPAQINQHREELEQFVHSFELIEEIPQR